MYFNNVCREKIKLDAKKWFIELTIRSILCPSSGGMLLEQHPSILCPSSGAQDIQMITANGTCCSSNVPQYYAHHQELETYTGDYSKWHMLLEQRPSTRTHSPQPHSRPHDQLLTKCHVPHTVITCIVSSS